LSKVYTNVVEDRVRCICWAEYRFEYSSNVYY